MKTLSKEELKQIVINESDAIYKENSALFIQHLKDAAAGKNDTEAVITSLSILYQECQRNIEDLLINTLDKLDI